MSLKEKEETIFKDTFTIRHKDNLVSISSFAMVTDQLLLELLMYLISEPVKIKSILFPNSKLSD